MFIPYLEQLEAECARRGIALEEVCRAHGIADTTLARWRKGQVNCREATARGLFGALEKIEADQAEAPQFDKVDPNGGPGPDTAPPDKQPEEAA